MRAVCLAGILAWAMAGQVAAVPVPLETLLDSADTAPAVQAAQAEYRASLAEGELRRIESGPQIFMNASAGRYRELNSADLTDDYYGRNATFGVRLPLLGSLRRQLDAAAGAGFETQRQSFELALRRAEHRLSLKVAYADWWRSQQEAALCGPLRKQADAAMSRIQRRYQAGWLRGSEALAETSAWEDLVARCAVAVELEMETRSYLVMLAGRTLPHGAQAVPVTLRVDTAPLEAWQALVQQHPGVRSGQATVEENRRLKERPWYSSVDASLSVAYGIEERSGVSRNGNSFVAALNLSIPFDVGGHVRAGGHAAVSRYQAARLEQEAQQRRLLAELATVLREKRQAHQTLQQEDRRIAVTTRRLAEQQARQSLEDDDALVLMLAAERDLLEARLARIAAWHALWTQHAGLQLFTDGNPEDAHLLGVTPVVWQGQAPPVGRSRPQPASTGHAAPAAWQTGAYVWDSRPLLNTARQAAELAALRAAGIERIYLGLDAGQVAAGQATRQAVAGLIEQARSQGLSVSLLLGEPTWMQPENRADLVGIIRRFQGLAFAALHLDLEVEQLGWPVPPSRLQQWLDTVAAVYAVSPWPIELSAHHRWFEAPQGDSLCIPCKLPELGVRGVSLMIYTRNIDRSSELARAAAQRWPALTFRLAQSMEPELSPDESWSKASAAQVSAAVETWRTRLQPHGVGGMDWQAWADLRRYLDASRHESQIR